MSPVERSGKRGNGEPFPKERREIESGGRGRGGKKKASTSTLLFAFTSQETGALSRVLHALSRNHKWTRMTVLDPRMIAWLSFFREPASLSAPGGGASSKLPLRRRSRSLPPPPPPPPPRSSTAPSSRRCRPTEAPRNRGAPSPLLRFLLGARTRRRNLLRSLFLRRRPPSLPPLPPSPRRPSSPSPLARTRSPRAAAPRRPP